MGNQKNDKTTNKEFAKIDSFIELDVIVACIPKFTKKERLNLLFCACDFPFFCAFFCHCLLLSFACQTRFCFILLYGNYTETNTCESYFVSVVIHHTLIIYTMVTQNARMSTAEPINYKRNKILIKNRTLLVSEKGKRMDGARGRRQLHPEFVPNTSRFSDSDVRNLHKYLH